MVDDDESVREAMSRILTDQGYFVDTAETGKRAIEKCESNYYNAALIDIRLPDLEGTELLSLLKKSIPKLIMVVITGYPSLENAVRAVNSGAHGYVIKPINPDDLLNKVAALLKKQQEEAEYGETKVAEYIETRLKQFSMQPKSIEPKSEDSDE